MLGFGLETIALLVGLSFLFEYIDSTFGMGYGTTLTPMLLVVGFEPLQIVPAVLLAELVCGFFAAFLHHKIGNVHFDFRNDDEHRIVKRLGKLGYLPKSRESKIAFVLAICSAAGVIIAVVLALNISQFYLKLYIGLLVLTMGILILWKRKTQHKFSWKKITGLGIVASFNKGMSGGGYGPLVVSGQILSGVESKGAIAITLLAEGVTCLVGVLTFFFLGSAVDWTLAPFLMIGAVLSVPFSAISVKKLDSKHLLKIIGVVTVLLGLFTLYKLFM